MPALIYKRGMHDGYQWVVTKTPELGTHNGYVCVPEDHPWMLLGDDYDRIVNNVPFGEITFHHGRWFGFDTMHAGQYWPAQIEYYNSISPGMGDHFKKTWNGLPAFEMTVEHVLTWVLQLCIDARDAYTTTKE